MDFNRQITGSVGTSTKWTTNGNTSVQSDGIVYDAPKDNSEYSDSIAYQVEHSAAYINAFNLFVKESNKMWLQRLQAIPYSVKDANETWLDQIGFSNKYSDKQDANYQYCMEQISALVAEYQTWKNSLPETQVQQMADAGINSAITGQGISGSEIPNVGVSTDPSKLESTNVGQSLMNGINTFLSLSSGTLDWIAKFNEIGLANRRFEFDEDKAFAEFSSILSSQGISIPFDATSFSELLENEDKEWLNNAPYRAKRILNQYQEILNMTRYGHKVVDETNKGNYRTGDFYSYDDASGKFITRFGYAEGASINLDEYSSHLANLEFDLFMNELEYKHNYAKKKKEFHDENGYTNAEDMEYYNSMSSALDAETKRYERDRLKIFHDYIMQLKKESDAGNISSRIQLMQAIKELQDVSLTMDYADEFWVMFKNWINEQ